MRPRAARGRNVTTKHLKSEYESRCRVAVGNDEDSGHIVLVKMRSRLAKPVSEDVCVRG